MKKFTFIFILLLFFINVGAREYFEKGDALYRDFKQAGVSLGHTGIYWDWDTDMDPANREAHWEIESSTEIPDTSHPEGVWSFTFKEFYERTTFWSVRTMPGLDWIMRNDIVKTAEHFRFEVDTDYDAFSGYKNPLGDPATFRCDGLVEYCYEIALGHDWEPGNNGGIIINDTWIPTPPPGQQTLWPWLQMEALQFRASAELHDIDIDMPVEGSTITGNFLFVASAYDGDLGSGTAKVEFYVDNNLVGTDVHESNIADWYIYEWDSRTVANGEHTLRVKGYDQAGNDNEAQVNFFVDNSVPRVVSTDPENGASDVDVYSDIVISFNREMDQSTVNSGTVFFSPPLHGSFTTEWSGDGKTVTLTLTNTEEDLKFYADYNIIVTDGVADINGTQLDGNRDDEGMFLRNGDWLLCNGKSSSLHSERRLALRYARSGFGCSATVGCSQGSKRNYLITNYEIL
jgi:hypothetical protein